MENDIRTNNEFQLTDAFGFMMEEGHIFKSLEINTCLDCGIPETILTTNQILLEREGKNSINPTSTIENSDLVCCTISENCSVINSNLKNIIIKMAL